MLVSSAKTKADLQDLAGSITPDGHARSPWRHMALAEHYPQDVAGFVRDAIDLEPQRILDVGCGDGYLALELARAGHHVIGIDRREETIATAQFTLQQASHEPSGSLAYECADFSEWESHAKFNVAVSTGRPCQTRLD